MRSWRGCGSSRRRGGGNGRGTRGEVVEFGVAVFGVGVFVVLTFLLVIGWDIDCGVQEFGCLWLCMGID